MDAFPLILDLTDRPCLLIGEGEAADQKASLLANAGALLNRRAGQTSAAEIRGHTLVVAATANEALARATAEMARREGVPVYVADRPALSTVIIDTAVNDPPGLLAIATVNFPYGSKSAFERFFTPLRERFRSFALHRAAANHHTLDF